MPVPVIDVHAHIIVPTMLRATGSAEAWRPRVWREGGRQVIEVDGREMRSAVREFVDIAEILRAQEERGVDRVVLSPWASLLRYDAPAPDALESGRLQNEALADLVRAYPHRISALGTVPLQDPALAADELATAVQDYGLVGAQIAASVRGVYLGDDRFRPFWEAAAHLGAVVFVHPTTLGFSTPALAEYYLWNAVGNPMETTISAAHLVMAGVLERYPEVKIVLAHGGGALTSLRGRLRRAHEMQPQARSALRGTPEESLRRLYFDTVVHDGGVLQALVTFAGSDHVVLGSDYPFDMGVDRPVEVVRQLALPHHDEAKILGGSAARVLGLRGTEAMA
jgi:aminocarboxymuconate-semialdehyde decarboxylase